MSKFAKNVSEFSIFYLLNSIPQQQQQTNKESWLSEQICEIKQILSSSFQYCVSKMGLGLCRGSNLSVSSVSPGCLDDNVMIG